MQSKASTVAEYLQGLTPERNTAISEVRKVILKNLQPGFEEAMNWGMITYQVPLETYPDTYNGQPLLYAALASQKNHLAVYLSAKYMNAESASSFEEAYRATGKRYDAGKSCVRFRKLEDLPLKLIGETIAEYSVEAFIEMSEKARASSKK